MATLREVSRERKRTFAQYKRDLRIIDTLLEKMERRIKRVQARKNVVPEDQDRIYLLDLLAQMGQEFDAFAEVLARPLPIGE